MAGFTVSVDRADGERREVRAGCCRAFGCYYRVGTGVAAWPVASLALWGSLGRPLDIVLRMPLHLTLFGELRNPTSQAVWGITKPYISRCVENPQFLVGGDHRFGQCRQLLFTIILCQQLSVGSLPPTPSFVSSWHSTAIARKRALSTQDPACCSLQNRAFPPNMRAQREPQNRVRDRTTLNHTTQ